MRIEIHCQGCGKVHDVPRTEEIKPSVHHLVCNWCPECEDQAEDYYTEWPVYKRKTKGRKSEIEQKRIDFRFKP